jgi:hypothetical protein
MWMLAAIAGGMACARIAHRRPRTPPVVQAPVLDRFKLQDVAIERHHPVDILHEQHRSVEWHRYFLFSSCANTDCRR